MIRVIGLGSPFGADRLGWDVVERLHGRVPAAVHLMTLDRPGVALISWMDNVDWLILVDAVVTERSPPGRVLHFAPEQIRHNPAGTLSSHGLNLPQTLRLASTLGSLPRRLDLFGVVVDACRTENSRHGIATGTTQLIAQLAAMLGGDHRPDSASDDPARGSAVQIPSASPIKTS